MTNFHKLTPRTPEELAFFLKMDSIPLVQALWEWMAIQGKIGTEIEVDLEEFERFTETHRGSKFARWWLKKQFNRLVDNRVIQIVKELKGFAYQLILRPFGWLKPRKKNKQEHLQNINSSCDLQPSNDLNKGTGLSSSSNSYSSISKNNPSEFQKILSLCAKAGVYFNQFDALGQELSQYRIEDVKFALEHFYSCGGFNKYPTGESIIPHPQEWVLQCLANITSISETKKFQEAERRHEILKLCLEHGIYFDPDKKTTQELFNYDIEDIKAALAHFVKRGGHETDAQGNRKIPNPQGWLISCLREGYWEDYEMTFSDALVRLASVLPDGIPRDYS